MSYVAVIVGISGIEYYLAPERLHIDGCTRPADTSEKKRARRFRSEGAAKTAAEGYIKAHARVVARAMNFRVEPAQ